MPLLLGLITVNQQLSHYCTFFFSWSLTEKDPLSLTVQYSVHKSFLLTKCRNFLNFSIDFLRQSPPCSDLKLEPQRPAP